MERDAELASAVLQDLEQALAGGANEAVPARRDRLAAEVDVDIVPVREFTVDRRGRDGIVFSDVLDREVGEDDAPTEGDARRIALEDLDLVARIAQLH